MISIMFGNQFGWCFVVIAQPTETEIFFFQMSGIHWASSMLTLPSYLMSCCGKVNSIYLVFGFLGFLMETCRLVDWMNFSFEWSQSCLQRWNNPQAGWGITCGATYAEIWEWVIFITLVSMTSGPRQILCLHQETFCIRVNCCSLPL